MTSIMQEFLPQLISKQTPFYFYNISLLKETLLHAKVAADSRGYIIHYAMKANSNDRILKEMIRAGFGVDCVSGNEVIAAINVGFSASQIAFAGVGKSDKEIMDALDNDIFCFNVESVPELRVINELASKCNYTARVALRINPNVDAHTHEYITTGLDDNKFGLSMDKMDDIVRELNTLKNVDLTGLHFHIGSQVENLESFVLLSKRSNEIQEWFSQRGINFQHINLGGGLGVNYDNPDENSIPNFEAFFNVFDQHLIKRENQTVHFELGRSLVANCGSLISKVLYVKEGINKKFVILDAGMTELIRPALYKASHLIENLSSIDATETYDVVGPICESSDCFGKDLQLNSTKRGDYIAIRSAGAYGEVMTSQYNLRDKVKDYYSE